jgi:hypothetical protein
MTFFIFPLVEPVFERNGPGGMLSEGITLPALSPQMGELALEDFEEAFLRK